jgi:hypothetical protein
MSTPPTTTPTATVGATPSWAVLPTAVDWNDVVFPVDDGCGPNTPVHWGVTQASVMHPSNGPELAVVLVGCQSGGGEAPSNLLVYDGAASATSPHYLQTLFAWPTQDYQARSFTAVGTTVSIAVSGYSTTSVARCCPNVHMTLRWTWSGSRLQAT